MLKMLKTALAAQLAAKAHWAAFRARHRISPPLWAKLATTVAKQRLWPRAPHGFAERNLDDGKRDVELIWLPDRRMWALWLRVDKEVYTDTKPKLRNFIVGVDDILSRAESGVAAEVVRPFG